MPGFIEMLPFSLQASRVNSSDLQECYNLSYETLQDRNVFLIKRATTTTSGGAEPRTVTEDVSRGKESQLQKKGFGGTNIVCAGRA